MATIENLLGKHYKWYFLLKHQFKVRTTYQIDNALFALGSVLTLLGTLLIWYVASGASLSEADFQEKVIYFTVGSTYLNLVNLWPSFYGYHIRDGKHTSDLMWPQNFFVLIWAKWFGLALYQNLILVGMILLTSPLWIGFTWQIFSLQNFLLTLLFLPISHVCLYFLELLVGFIAFFITEVNGLILNYGFIKNLLAGQLFPLGLLIPYFWVNALNPFAYLFYHPMQVYLGKYSATEIGLVLFGGVVWALVLYLVASKVLRFGLKKNESVGL